MTFDTKGVPVLEELAKDLPKDPVLVQMVLDRLVTTPVYLSLDENSANDAMTQQAGIALLALLGRAIPEVWLSCPDTANRASGPYAGHSRFHAALDHAFKSGNENARIHLEPAPAGAIHVRLGDGFESADLFVDVDGWNVFVTREARAAPAARKWNPASPLAAASLAATRVVWRIIEPNKPVIPITTSLLTYGPPEHAPNPDVPRTIDVGRLVFLGVGSVATSLIWCLASATPSGHITLVDHDTGEKRNLARYVLLSLATYAQSKVQAASAALRESSPNVTVDSRKESIHDYGSRLGATERMPLAIISADNLEARREAADLNPRVAIVATTRQSTATALHAHFASTICAYCCYVPPGEAPHQWEIWSQFTGLNADRIEKLSIPPVDSSPQHLPLDASDITTIEKHLNFRPGSLETWQGRTLREFLDSERSRLYSARSVAREGATSNAVNVALAPVSGLAGALAAAELLKELDSSLHAFSTSYGRVDIDLAAGKDAVALPVRRASTKCLCQHPLRQLAHARIYPEDASKFATWSSRWNEAKDKFAIAEDPA